MAQSADKKINKILQILFDPTDLMSNLLSNIENEMTYNEKEKPLDGGYYLGSLREIKKELTNDNELRENLDKGWESLQNELNEIYLSKGYGYVWKTLLVEI